MMISQHTGSTVVMCIFILLTISCSGGDTNRVPSAPCLVPETIAQQGQNEGDGAGGHTLWAYYLIAVNSESGEADIIPVRVVAGHWNVLKFLENGPCLDCMKVNGITPTPDGTILFDVEIRHPFATANLTGFDVRGIAMFHGGYVFPVAGLMMPDRSAGDGELVNPDGYTALYNSSTAGSGPGGLQGYVKGKFATLTVPDASLNGYKRYVSPGAANTRNAFYAGSTLLSTFELDMPDTGFVFGYAIDASWDPPTVKPVTDPITDFPPEANCPEPWKIDVTVEPVGLGLTDQGGEATLVIDVYDWQGSESHLAPVVECPSLFDGAQAASFIQDYAGYSRWEVVVGNENVLSPGSHRCLVKVVDDEDLVAPPWLDLTAYQVTMLQVRESGWSRTCGGIGNDSASDTAVDATGDIYIIGYFHDTVDLDPGPGIENHMSSGSQDLFISKYNSNGDYVWSRVWGGPMAEGVRSIFIDSSGNIYMTGSFAGTSDFDPGPGIDSRTADWWDAFLNKYDADGNYQWVVTWSGSPSEFEIGMDVVVDSLGDIYVAGYFEGTVDLDPGPGVEEYASAGGEDISLSKFDPDGNLQWALAIGGVDNDEGQSVTVDTDNNPCIGGNFMDTVDFDPDVGDQNRLSEGSSDAFLAKFDPYGNYLWADTWGGDLWDILDDIEFDSDSGSLYATGSFRELVDFNPGPDMDSHISNGEDDIFVISLQSDNGAFLWANTWGAGGDDSGDGLAVSPLGSVVVSGQFSLTADFDPGAGIDNHTSNGDTDAFITQFDSTGSFDWARTWGGSETDYDYEVDIAQSDGDIYTVGRFETTVDMNPGPDVDNHVSNGETDFFLTKFLSTGLW